MRFLSNAGVIHNNKGVRKTIDDIPKIIHKRYARLESRPKITNKPRDAKAIINPRMQDNIIHHGTDVSTVVLIPLKASTIISLDDQIEVINITEQATRKPPNQPEMTDSISQENLNTSTPISEYISWNPSATKKAIKRPSKEPNKPAKNDASTPSIITKAEMSLRFSPNILNSAKSDFLACASIEVIVIISKKPAAIMNPPKIKKVPDITPLLASTSSIVSTLGEETRKYES